MNYLKYFCWQYHKNKLRQLVLSNKQINNKFVWCLVLEKPSYIKKGVVLDNEMSFKLQVKQVIRKGNNNNLAAGLICGERVGIKTPSSLKAVYCGNRTKIFYGSWWWWVVERFSNALKLACLQKLAAWISERYWVLLLQYPTGTAEPPDMDTKESWNLQDNGKPWKVD